MATAITDHFTLEEFAVSASHPSFVRPVPSELVSNVERLVRTVLDPMRHVWGRPLRVLSGYRSQALNVAVGGSPTSQHLLAEAADVTTEGVRQLFRSIMVREPKFPTGQVIYYPSRSFVHIALPGARYPKPTFCLHEPSRGWVYRVLEDVAEFDRLAPG